MDKRYVTYEGGRVNDWYVADDTAGAWRKEAIVADHLGREDAEAVTFALNNPALMEFIMRAVAAGEDIGICPNGEWLADHIIWFEEPCPCDSGHPELCPDMAGD